MSQQPPPSEPQILASTRVCHIEETGLSSVRVTFGVVQASTNAGDVAAISGTLSRALRRHLTPEVFEELPRLVTVDGQPVPPRRWDDPVLAKSRACKVELDPNADDEDVFLVHTMGLCLEVRLPELGALAGSFRHAVRRLFSSPLRTIATPVAPPVRRGSLRLVSDS